MRATACILVVAILAACTVGAADQTTDLNVTRVAVFSSGVAYFEREASINGATTAELKFRTQQINDILKSMLVQDAGGGKIGVISYASQDPIEKTLRSFGVDLTGKPTLGQLLDQLRGEPVQITGDQSLKGIIVGVEKSPIVSPDGKTLQEIERLTLLTDSGLEHLDLTKLVGSIKLTNEKVDAELRKALATLASAHDADKKSVLVSFEGDGQRKVRIAYLLEAPIWKTSYRLVLSEDKKPMLQGWATIENATEEDWKDVRLSLVSGRPISFRMDLYTPLYVPRPMEQLELYASLKPPSYAGGFEEGEKAGGAVSAFGQNQAKPETAAGKEAGGAGGARAARAMTKLGVPAGAPPPAPPTAGEDFRDTDWYELTVESVATAKEAGELFAYHIDRPVSLARQRSALLPIANQEVEAEKISIFNPATHPKYPLNGLELKNTTKLNLMQGPVTVFDGATYAGDAKLPDLKPDEKRLVAYALDLGTEVMIKQPSQPDEIVSLKISKGTLWHSHKQVDAREYSIKNKQDKAKQVVLEQSFSNDWKLMEPKEPYERTESLLRFKVSVPADKTVTQTVKLERVWPQSITLGDAGLDNIRFFLSAKVISPPVKQALEKVIVMRNEADELARRRVLLEKQRDEATKEQARIRENLKTLDKSSDAYKRQLKNFDEVDARIIQLGTDVDAARQQEEAKRLSLNDYLLGLNVE